jgi:hypothetical protein
VPTNDAGRALKLIAVRRTHEMGVDKLAQDLGHRQTALRRDALDGMGLFLGQLNLRSDHAVMLAKTYSMLYHKLPTV